MMKRAAQLSPETFHAASGFVRLSRRNPYGAPEVCLAVLCVASAIKLPVLPPNPFRDRCAD
jgi:hypothetical protein